MDHQQCWRLRSRCRVWANGRGAASRWSAAASLSAGDEPVSPRALANGAGSGSLQAMGRGFCSTSASDTEVVLTCGLPLRRADVAISAGAATALLLVA